MVVSLIKILENLECLDLHKDVPDAVSIDITPVKIGDKVRVTDLSVP